jgi:hypothetical protein
LDKAKTDFLRTWRLSFRPARKINHGIRHLSNRQVHTTNWGFDMQKSLAPVRALVLFFLPALFVLFALVPGASPELHAASKSGPEAEIEEVLRQQQLNSPRSPVYPRP